MPDICDVAAASSDPLIFTGSGSLDPNLDTSCTGGIVTQAGGPEICVVHSRSIIVSAGATLTITGRAAPGRAIALVADDGLSIDGFLDLSAHSNVNGPGGGVSISGGQVSAPKAGGGAGGKTDGAAGGNDTTDGGAVNGGPAAVNTAALNVLVGGASAYKFDANTDPTDSFGGGGGGGGATLISCRSGVTISGTVNAGGGGGRGGFTLGVSVAVPARAGGAGGYLAVQASTISITGLVFANGGAGGNGRWSNGNTGADGPDGSLSNTAAARPIAAQESEGRGGAGGIGTTPPTVGGHPTQTGATAAGGGGSVGFLATFMPQNRQPSLSPMQVSPPFESNGAIPVR